MSEGKKRVSEQVSYKVQVKKELCALEVMSDQEKKAVLSGMLAVAAIPVFNERSEVVSLRLRTDVPQVAGALYRYSRSLFGMVPDVRSRKVSLPQNQRLYEVIYESSEIIAMLRDLRMLKRKDGKNIYDVRTIPPYFADKQLLLRAYIRGVFLTAGTITEPEKDFRLEVVCDQESFLRSLIQVLSQYDIHMRLGRRHKRYVMVTGEAESVSLFLQLMGANKAFFGLENIRVVREISNNANRQVNCDVSNLKKMTAAANKQMAVIRAIEAYQGLKALPESLRQLAELRKRYPDISIQELGERMVPPLGKSGVYKRFEKMTKLAEKLQGEESLNG